MKKMNLKFGVFGCMLVLLMSCGDDVDEITDLLSGDTTAVVKETELSAQADASIETINDIIVEGFEDAESTATNKVLKNKVLSACATTTVDLSATPKKVTIDFGTEGCAVLNGEVLKGKLILSYTGSLADESVVISSSFDAFFVDGVQYLGTKTVTRIRASATVNPQYTMDLDVSLVFEGGEEAIRTGTITRAWIEGVLNGNFEDNVFQTTGAWTTTFESGTPHKTTITTPLRREASCRYLVSGVAEIVRTNFSGTLNFGAGTCDNKATFSIKGGTEVQISL